MAGKYEPGYVEVPGKGTRYRNSKGEYFHNHFGAIGNSFANVFRGAGNAYNNYYNSVADAVGTQRRDGTVASPKPKSKDQKAGAPPQAAVKPRGQNLPPSAAVPGTGPKGNTVGSDADPDTPGLQGPGAVKPGARVNANGLVSYGRDLSSLNKFTSAFTGGYELTDIKSAFQSNALPTTASGEKQGHEAPRTNYSWDSESEEGVWNDETGRLELPTAPGTTGGKPVNAQDGTSSKPDVAESIRTVRMQRQSGRGSRRDPRNRGENADMFGGPEPSDESLTSPMYANEKRNKIRSAFLDMDTPIIQASVKANAIAGYGKDSDGNARFNYGGELVYAKDGMQQKAKNAAMMGQDPTQFLDIPATPDTQPDTPAASELSPAFAQETPGAQEFFRTELKKVKDKNK